MLCGYESGYGALDAIWLEPEGLTYEMLDDKCSVAGAFVVRASKVRHA